MSKRHTLISCAAAAALAFAGSALAEQGDSMKSGASDAKTKPQQEQQQEQPQGMQDAQPSEGTQARPGETQTGAQSPGYTRAAAPIGPGEQYVVKEGDTLSKLAQRFLGSSDEWQQIARANDIQNPEELAVGQRLTIPGADRTGQSQQQQQQQMQQGQGQGERMPQGGTQAGPAAGGLDETGPRPGSARP